MASLDYGIILQAKALILMAVFVCGLSLVSAARAAESGIVSNIKVVSDKVEDVSSVEAWEKAFIRPEMTPREKVQAVWLTTVKFRHQNPPPTEYLQTDDGGFCVHDAIKMFNVYGYNMCCCESSNVQSLGRAVGLESRGRAVHGHSLPEFFWDGKWHMIDASLVTYFLDEKGEIVGVDELIDGVSKWFKQHPEMKGNDKALREMMRDGGWKKGPAVIATCPFLDKDGWFPAGTHGWYAPMGEYDGSVNDPYQYPYSMGYRVNIQLREGEVLTRNWSNKGLHVDMDLGHEPSVLKTEVGTGDMKYAVEYGDMSRQRIGNGTLLYDVPVGTGAVATSALAWENLACKADDDKAPALHVKDASRAGTAVIRMPSPYVYLSGKLTGTFVVGSGGSVRISMSRNNGLDWKEIYAQLKPGRHDETVDLSKLTYRLYDYRLKFDISGAGTGIDSLRIEHDIQHSQRALPALGRYDNTITFSAEPAEGTVTIEALPQPKSRGNQLVASEFHPQLDGAACTDKGLEATRDGGTATFAVETPGEMTRVRFGCFALTATKEAGWDLLVSFDEGRTWNKAGRASGITPGAPGWVKVDAPAGTRRALVRYAGGKPGEATIVNFRIDADYREPNGGFKPVKITYAWREGNEDRTDVHVARSPEETYVIRCTDKPMLTPEMKSITLELAKSGL